MLKAYSLFATLVTSIVFSPQIDAAEPTRWSRIPADSFAVVSLELEALKKTPDLNLVPWEALSAISLEQLGIDLMNIRFADLAIGVPSSTGVEFSMEITTTLPVDIQYLIPDGFGPLEQSKRDPNMKFRRVDGAPILVAQVSPTHLLVGTENQLKQVLALQSSKSPLGDLIQESEGHLRGAVSIEPLRPIVAQAFATPRPQNGPQLYRPTALWPAAGPIYNIVKSTKFLKFDIKVDANVNLSAEVVASENVPLQELRQELSSARDGVFVYIEQEMRKLLPSHKASPSIQTAFAKYLRRLKDHFNEMEIPIEKNRLRMQGELTAAPTIALGTGMLVPAIQNGLVAIKSGRTAVKLRKIGMAAWNYESAYKMFPPRAIKDSEGKDLLSWRVALLPYMGEENLYQQFHLDEPWDSPHNLKLVEQMPDIYKHGFNKLAPGMTTYVAPYHKNSFWNLPKIRMGEIVDGTSNTILLVDAPAQHAVIWSKPDDFDVEGKPMRSILGPHGGYVLMMDMAVKKVDNNVDERDFQGSLTHMGGEVYSLR